MTDIKENQILSSNSKLCAAGQEKQEKRLIFVFCVSVGRTQSGSVCSSSFLMVSSIKN